MLFFAIVPILQQIPLLASSLPGPSMLYLSEVDHRAREIDENVITVSVFVSIKLSIDDNQPFPPIIGADSGSQ
jgi:hypothetical protein